MEYLYGSFQNQLRAPGGGPHSTDNSILGYAIGFVMTKRLKLKNT